MMSQQQQPSNCVDPRSAVADQQHGNLVMHVRGDSETELDLLFSVLNSNEQPKPSTRSFRDMNLPLSFFRPPDPKLQQQSGCHSRDGSIDFNRFQGAAQQQQQGGLPIFHSRSHSSPAQLPLPMSIAPAPGGGGGHMKQGSVDGLIDDLSLQQQQQHQLQQQQQPNGWCSSGNTAAANQKYFMK